MQYILQMHMHMLVRKHDGHTATRPQRSQLHGEVQVNMSQKDALMRKGGTTWHCHFI